MGSSSRTSPKKGYQLQLAMNQAELHARKRDEIDLEYMELQERKANEQGFTVIKKRTYNRAQFIQIIYENYDYLRTEKYLTRAEKAFILDLTVLTELYTNAIADKKTGHFYSISQIARKLERDLSGTSDLINQLIQKCIIYEFVDAFEIKEFGRNVTERPLFFNPEIVCCSDRNRINPTLTKLAIRFDRLERNKVFLPWKLMLEPNAKYGKLEERRKR